MNKVPKYPRILAIAPSTVGFGFALLEGQEVLVDWGVKAVKGDKNRQCVIKAKKLMDHYQPNVLVLEDALAKDSHRGRRNRALTKKLAALAASEKINAVLFSKKELMKSFCTEGCGTKHALAEIIANKYPDELKQKLPSKRREWESENPRTGMFVAVALALKYI